MTTLQLLASVIFTAILVTISASLYIHYQAGEELNAFERGAEDLANRIRSLAAQDPGAGDYLDINIPKNCELRFEDSRVVVTIGANPKIQDVGVVVSGPTLQGWSGQLRLERTQDGVEVNTG